ncbi:MAG: acetyltransferase [Paenibacillaceae bacterium]|jgi:acetyltransferase-like isoleucine patch superfamily enzyme|nr:acetyltransferase [Paenibacillaceae bacterium]
MSLWTLLEGGHSMPGRQTAGARLAARIGYWLANRHKQASVHPGCLISPEAKVNPRSGRIEIGEGSLIAAGALIQGNVRIGRNCSVQAYSNIVGYGDPDNREGWITIGNDVRIASHAIMIAANHRFEDAGRTIRSQGVQAAPITIEDDVWIGGRVSITAGVTIGRGSVIGGGAVVTRDIPPYSVAVGVPAKVVRQRGEQAQDHPEEEKQ